MRMVSVMVWPSSTLSGEASVVWMKPFLRRHGPHPTVMVTQVSTEIAAPSCKTILAHIVVERMGNPCGRAALTPFWQSS